MDQRVAAVLLAAGDGKRMKSSHQKVCCELLGKPMLRWVLDACARAQIPAENTCAVISDEPRGVTGCCPMAAAPPFRASAAAPATP